MTNKLFDFKFLALLILISIPTFAGAVSQKEMEQARTIAAKAYLRYANDGSGYLDDLNPKTMDELEGLLKAKEKENLKAFKAIAVPSDYKDWNKDKLVEYWAVTAFQDKGLLEKGRGGRLRARSQINKMTIAPPQAETSAAPASTPTVASSPVPQDSVTNNPEAELAALSAEQEALLEQEAEDADLNVDKATNYTWVYIMVLAILVAIVVALVVYAANVMKKNGASAGDNRHYDDNTAEEIEHYESLVSDKDVEIGMLKKKLESATKQNSDLKAKIEALSSELAILRSASQVKPAIEPSRQKNVEEPTPKAALRSIFLGRANMRGIFVRADRTLNVGHSVFVLDTTDGYSGSFRVADSPAAWSLALSNPREYLETACTGHDLEDTIDVSRIVTESSGTAVFEGGCWRVIRKAKIKYE